MADIDWGGLIKGALPYLALSIPAGTGSSKAMDRAMQGFMIGHKMREEEDTKAQTNGALQAMFQMDKSIHPADAMASIAKNFPRADPRYIAPAMTQIFGVDAKKAMTAMQIAGDQETARIGNQGRKDVANISGQWGVKEAEAAAAARPKRIETRTTADGNQVRETFDNQGNVVGSQDLGPSYKAVQDLERQRARYINYKRKLESGATQDQYFLSMLAEDNPRAASALQQGNLDGVKQLIDAELQRIDQQLSTLKSWGKGGNTSSAAPADDFNAAKDRYLQQKGGSGASGSY